MNASRVALNVANAERLITRLESVDDGRVDMDRWFTRIEIINGEEKRFNQWFISDMNLFAEDCGTAACAAGHTAIMFAKEDGIRWTDDGLKLADKLDGMSISDYAAGKLGLDKAEARVLFFAEHWPKKYSDLSLEKSERIALIALLRDMVAGGKKILFADMSKAERSRFIRIWQ